MKNQLEQLKQFTTVVADTGNFDLISQYAPQDATTNPSLIYLASQNEAYLPLIEDAISYGKSKKGNIKQLILEKVLVNFGIEILKIIPGRVSIEVDAKLSYDTTKSIKKAKELISLFEQEGIHRNRLLIKLAATWEGIRAAEILEKEEIHCNLTLVFHLAQALACAKANVTIISPFVGRILDWHKKQHPLKTFLPHEDPGVTSVSTIYSYFKKFDYSTKIMGASFRNKEEILELAGCDFLTISPKLLEELKKDTCPIQRKLSPLAAKKMSLDPITITKDSFHNSLKSCPMASEKLTEGIQNFVQDQVKLENLLFEKFSLFSYSSFY